MYYPLVKPAMKISELASATGESIPTIKFYIREQLLPPGESTGRNQARYAEHHAKRIDLIRTLKSELGMSVEKIREVLLEAEQGGEALLAAGLRGARQSRHGSAPEDQASPKLGEAWSLLKELGSQLAWEIDPGDPSAEDVAGALATILRVMPDAHVENSLVDYATIMKQIADAEIPDNFDPTREPFDALRYAVLGTYLFEPLLLALRRLAHGQRVREVYARRNESG